MYASMPVLYLCLDGFSTKEVAERWHVSLPAVSLYRRQLNHHRLEAGGFASRLQARLSG